MVQRVRMLINGKSAESVSAWDRGFQYGDGIFETLAVRDDEPLLWDRHLQRLHRGAERLGLTAPAEELWRREAQEVCRATARGVLKLVLTRGVSGRGYAPMGGAPSTRAVGLLAWPDYPAHRRREGVTVQFCRTPISRHPGLAGLKHLNRLEQVLARGELRADCAEGLMLDEHGHVIEGTMSNLFIARDGKLLTPALTHSGVEGVMRGLVLDQAAALSMPCSIRDLTRAEVLEADEVFLTNSLIGLWPVRRLETRDYPLGPIGSRLMEAIRDACIAD